MLRRIYQTAQHSVSLNYRFFFYFAVKEFTYSVILNPRVYEIVRSAKFQLAKVPFQTVGGAVVSQLLLGEK